MDRLTLEAARRGRREAQASLLRELQEPWYRMCLGLLRDPEAAREAVQETALRFLRSLPAFRGDSELLTWSLGIAINVTREMRRELGRAAQKPLRLDAALIAERRGVTGSPADSLSQEDAASRLRQALNDLPDRQREALLLRFFEDLSVEQTASAMNCAAGTVKATVHQALRSLRQKLKQLQ